LFTSISGTFVIFSIRVDNEFTPRVVLPFEYGKAFTDTDIAQINSKNAGYNFRITGQVGAFYIIDISCVHGCCWQYDDDDDIAVGMRINKHTFGRADESLQICCVCDAC
jgi:hypothetical protein